MWRGSGSVVSKDSLLQTVTLWNKSQPVVLTFQAGTKAFFCTNGWWPTKTRNLESHPLASRWWRRVVIMTDVEGVGWSEKGCEITMEPYPTSSQTEMLWFRVGSSIPSIPHCERLTWSPSDPVKYSLYAATSSLPQTGGLAGLWKCFSSHLRDLIKSIWYPIIWFQGSILKIYLRHKFVTGLITVSAKCCWEIRTVTWLFLVCFLRLHWEHSDKTVFLCVASALTEPSPIISVKCKPRI